MDSEELEWELYEMFVTDLFAFPIYEHRTARKIVHYLLMRGVLDEEIADAIEDSTADLHIWLSHSGKNMVGEWVIAWINDCRDEFKREQGWEMERSGYAGAYDISPDGSLLSELEEHSDDPDDDDDDLRPSTKRGLQRQQTASTVELASTVSRAGTSTTLSHQNSVETELDFADDSDVAEDSYTQTQPQTRQTRVEQLLEIQRSLLFKTPYSKTNGNVVHLSESEDDLIPAKGCNKSFDKDRFRKIVRCGTRLTLQRLSGDITDLKPDDGSAEITTQHNEINNKVTSDEIACFSNQSISSDNVDHYSESFEQVLDVQAPEMDTEQQGDLGPDIILPQCPDCQCTIPHYYHQKVNDTKDDVLHIENDYEELEVMDRADSVLELNISDNMVRAMEINIGTLELDGPGYLYVMTDTQQACVQWSEEQRYKVASSRNPEKCLLEFRSRNVDLALIWQKKVQHHLKATRKVHESLQPYNVHSNWFQCSLGIIMKAVSLILKQHTCGN